MPCTVKPVVSLFYHDGAWVLNAMWLNVDGNQKFIDINDCQVAYVIQPDGTREYAGTRFSNEEKARAKAFEVARKFKIHLFIFGKDPDRHESYFPKDGDLWDMNLKF